MASTGNVFPGTAANVDRGGTSNVWSNPGNVVSDNTSDATVTVPSDYLVCSNFDFSSIPDNSLILGITVRVEASETGTGNSNYIPRLHSNTTPTLIGSAKTAVTVNGTTKVVSTRGGTSDLWGATLTAATVKSSGFGVSIWSTDTTNTLAIDYVTMAVEYAPPVSGDLAATESGSDTASMSGDVIVQGSMAATESGADTFAGEGDVIVQGALAVTETGADTFAADGTVADNEGVSGDLAATETGSDTFAGTGGVLVQGAAAATESGADAFASTGSVLVQGTLAATETGADAMSATGAVLVQGALAATEIGADTFAGTGTVPQPPITGTLAAVESGSDTFISVGTTYPKTELLGGGGKQARRIAWSDLEDDPADQAQEDATIAAAALAHAMTAVFASGALEGML